MGHLKVQRGWRQVFAPKHHGVGQPKPGCERLTKQEARTGQRPGWRWSLPVIDTAWLMPRGRLVSLFHSPGVHGAPITRLARGPRETAGNKSMPGRVNRWRERERAPGGGTGVGNDLGEGSVGDR